MSSIDRKNYEETQHLPLTGKHNRSLPVCPDVVLPILALVGIGLMCCLFPQVQQLISRTITHIGTESMTLGSAIALIGIPAIAGTLLIAGMVLLIKTHHQRSFETLQDGSFNDVIETFESCFSKKSWVAGAVTIAGLVIAGLAMWYLKPFPNVLGHPIRIWQGLAYFGGGGIAATGLVIGMVCACGRPPRDQAGESLGNLLLYQKHKNIQMQQKI